MTPAPAQQGTETNLPEPERHVKLWPEQWLLNLKLHTVETAQNYLGAANKYNASKTVRRHFYSEVQRLQG